MKIYEISYSLCAGGIIQIVADSQEKAEAIFDNMQLDKLFETKDLYKGIEIDEITYFKPT